MPDKLDKLAEEHTRPYWNSELLHDEKLSYTGGFIASQAQVSFYAGWHARDGEVEALKEIVAFLTEGLERIELNPSTSPVTKMFCRSVIKDAALKEKSNEQS